MEYVAQHVHSAHGTMPVIEHKEHDVRGGHSTRTFDQTEARFACGSMVRFFLFYKKVTL
jgi:hypothetical protein